MFSVQIYTIIYLLTEKCILVYVCISSQAIIQPFLPRQEEQVIPRGMWLLNLTLFYKKLLKRHLHTHKFSEIFQSSELKTMTLNLAREKKLHTEMWYVF